MDFKFLRRFIKNRGKVTSSLDENDILEESSLISKTHADGTIHYVNEKFLDVTKYDLNEVIGKNHRLFNSGYHSKELWHNMYNQTANHQIWHHPCIVNKNKYNELYYVKVWIQAEFNAYGHVIGYVGVNQDITELVQNHMEIEKKNTYLEYAAKILRHDMHSGIKTYIPRGIKSLKRRLGDDMICKLNLTSTIKLLEEGLVHTQKIYNGVYEFTNLVKSGGTITKEEYNIKDILETHLKGTSYGNDVYIEKLPNLMVNESLFCTAIDNFIRNGLKYNDSKTKIVRIYFKDGYIYVEDNGRGLTTNQFHKYSKPYTRKKNQRESGTGLGLNIALAILREHNFEVNCDGVIGVGTTIKIKCL